MKHMINVKDFAGQKVTSALAGAYGGEERNKKNLSLEATFNEDGEATFNFIVKDHDKIIIETVFFDVAVDHYNNI